MMKSQNARTTIILKGKVSYYPSTLNNRIHTYFLADYWARQSVQGNQKCSAENWMKMVQSVSKINHDYERFVGKKMLRKFNLFNTWGLYGDGMALVQLNAIGQFDSEEEKIKLYRKEEQYSISTKLGQHKSAISDSDTDCQNSTRWFGLELQIEKQNSFIKFEHTSLKHLSQRIKTDIMSAAPIMKGDWYFIGKRFQYFKVDKEKPQIKNEDQNKQSIFLRLNQYRYNMQTKLSTVKGYYVQTSTHSNDPNMQGWRRVYMIDSQTTFKPVALLLKSTKTGLLLDLGSIILDTNDLQKNPLYPKKFSLKIFYEINKELVVDFNDRDAEVDLKTINNDQGGLLFIKTVEQLKKQSVFVSFTFQFSKQQANEIQKTAYKFEGLQTQYHLNCTDNIKKSKVSNNPIFHQQFLNEVQFQLYCTRFGEPYTGKLDLTLTCDDWHDRGGIEPSLKLQQSYEQALKVELFLKKYKSLEYINQQIYFGNLQKVTEIADTLTQRMIIIKSTKIQDNQKITQKKVEQKSYQHLDLHQQLEFTQKAKRQVDKPLEQNQSTHWRIMCNQKPTEDYFTLKFAKTDKNISGVSFEHGKAIVEMRLNVPLTADNNPRRPAFNSLVTSGTLLVKQNIKQLSETTRVYGYFFQTGDRMDKQSQWNGNVGITLKKFALMYPSMQKIANIFDFQALQMPALRRVFDVEDENNPRYMPSTRQMSALEHRQIRRWLYKPTYDSKVLTFMKSKRYKRQAKRLVSLTSQKKLDFKNDQKNQIQKLETLKIGFEKKKNQLIENLKCAFKIELITIPMYLSAMFSLYSKTKAHQILRSIAKDQMKHLSIVSNILNSIIDPGSKDTVPFGDKKFLPIYPILNKDLPGIFHAKDLDLCRLFTFDIQPCLNEQILKFTLLQIPGELDNLFFEYQQTPQTLESTIRSVRVNKLNSYIALMKKQMEQNQYFLTIGQVYSNIIQKFWYLNDLEEFINRSCNQSQKKVRLFTGDITKQFIYPDFENMTEVYDLKTALNQFRLIVQQGEGANLLTVGKQGIKMSHFLKFVSIYTGCVIKKTEKLSFPNEFGQNTLMIKIFLEADSEMNIELINSEQRWTKQIDRYFQKQTAKEFNSQSVKQDSSSYTDSYAKQALKNSYKSMLQELDLLFNTGFNEFSYQYKERLEQIQMRKLFEETRKLRMQESIASMRRLRLHADKVIRYSRSSDDPSIHKNLGSRPDFNLSQ